MDSIKQLHEDLFLFLEDLRESNKDQQNLKYTFRKDNFGNKLTNGYWFLGDENNLIISFWSGDNFYTKKPNISINFELETSLIYLDITIEKTTSDLFENAGNKFVLFHDFILPDLYELEKQEEKDFYIYRRRLGPIEFWKDILRRFIINEKNRIDDLIINYQKQFGFDNISTRYAIGQIDEDLFKRNLRKIKRYRDQLIDLKEYENASYYNKQKPFYIKSFQIQEYGHINNMSINNIPFDNRWIFITGENGSGKTSLLKALALFLGQGRIRNNNIKKTEEPTFNATLLGINTNEKKLERIGNDSESKKAKRSILRGFAAYGIHRTVIKSPYYLLKQHHELSKNGFLDSILSDGITPLIDFNRTIEEWTENKDNLERFSHRREFFVKALLKTVPGLVDIHFVNASRGLTSDFYIRFDEGPVIKVSYEQLSSGSKSILSFVADVIVRFYKQQPEAYDPSEFKGVVIVDEIDLHLHPQGQKKIILALSEVFPNIQFVVSTHSPIPLLGAPKNSVICVVKRNLEKGTYLERVDDKIYFQDLMPNTILTSPIFNMEDITNDSREKSRMVRTEKTFDEMQFVDKLKTKINEFITDEREEQLIKLFESRRK
jgi:predicted ATP-binding protein involved in virulence